jgi:sporulation protein YlmC with PRC-barrel domain
VIGSDGERLGSVSRLVVDETAHRVTHLVIGNRVVGIGHLRPSPDGRLTVDLDREGFKSQPDIIAARVEGVPTHWEAPEGWTHSSFVRIAGALFGQSPYTPPVEVDDDVANVHELTEGSPVWSGYTELGRIQAVDTADDGTITRLIVESSEPRRKVAVPIEAVQEVVGNNVHLNLSPAEFHKLPSAEEDR